MGCTSSVGPAPATKLVSVKPNGNVTIGFDGGINGTIKIDTTALPPPTDITESPPTTTGSSKIHKDMIVASNNNLLSVIPISSSTSGIHAPLHSILRQPSKLLEIPSSSPSIPSLGRPNSLGVDHITPITTSQRTPSPSHSRHPSSHITSGQSPRGAAAASGHPPPHPTSLHHQHSHRKLHHQTSRSQLHHNRMPSSGGGSNENTFSGGGDEGRRSVRRNSEFNLASILHINTSELKDNMDTMSISRPNSRPASRPASAKPPPKISPRSVSHLVTLCATIREDPATISAIRDHINDEEVTASPAFESCAVWAPALEAAIAYNNISVVKLLLQLGASPQVYGTTCTRHKLFDPHTSSLRSITEAALAADRCAPAAPLDTCTPIQRDHRSLLHTVQWLYRAADGNPISHREAMATPLFDACRADSSRLPLIRFLIREAHATISARRLDLGPPSSRWRPVHDHWYAHDLNGVPLADVQIAHTVPTPAAACCFYSGSVDVLKELLWADPLCLDWSSLTAAFRDQKHCSNQIDSIIPTPAEDAANAIQRARELLHNRGRAGDTPLQYYFNDLGPLHLAAWGCHPSLVEWLVSHIDAGSITVGDHHRILHGADQIGWLAHTDVNQTPQEVTPLQLMCLKARDLDPKRAEATVAALVSYGADSDKIGLFHSSLKLSATATIKASSGHTLPDWFTRGVTEGKRIAGERSKKRRDILYGVLRHEFNMNIVHIITILHSFLPW